jgi:PP-loop superfamily ATP-utilizing enzyme
MRPQPAPDRGGVATAFSGGKDSLLQIGLLARQVHVASVTSDSPAGRRR